MGSSMAPSRRRLVTGPRESELGFLPERFAKALVDPQGMEGGTPTNLSTPGPKRVGCLPAAATQCGAVLGLTRNSGRHAPAIIHVCTPETRLRQWARADKREYQMKGGFWPPPHRAEPFSDSPTIVGGAHQPVCDGRRHTVRSRSRTRPQRQRQFAPYADPTSKNKERTNVTVHTSTVTTHGQWPLTKAGGIGGSNAAPCDDGSPAGERKGEGETQPYRRHPRLRPDISGLAQAAAERRTRSPTALGSGAPPKTLTPRFPASVPHPTPQSLGRQAGRHRPPVVLVLPPATRCPCSKASNRTAPLHDSFASLHDSPVQRYVTPRGPASNVTAVREPTWEPRKAISPLPAINTPPRPIVYNSQLADLESALRSRTRRRIRRTQAHSPVTVRFSRSANLPLLHRRHDPNGSLRRGRRRHRGPPRRDRRGTGPRRHPDAGAQDGSAAASSSAVPGHRPGSGRQAAHRRGAVPAGISPGPAHRRRPCAVRRGDPDLLRLLFPHRRPHRRARRQRRRLPRLRSRIRRCRRRDRSRRRVLDARRRDGRCCLYYSYRFSFVLVCVGDSFFRYS
ncbi:hypothetical protein SORBI_3001G476400 [Sorghum bicolor]|uniref:Uncharacterized protein n=1 Tax=Sorghum bicolor TaxID=4558 RepID=A0A1B6QQ20_SORBI|nr:hypothetical protein SORBI_3001G476400 [Sorghum bicolor]